MSDLTVPVCLTVALFAVFGTAIYFGVQGQNERERVCKAREGHLISTRKSDLCISADGRIID